MRAYAPYSGTRYDLAAGKFITKTQGIPIAKGKKARTVSDSFTRLKLTGNRILSFIDSCEGIPNKDMEKFANELEALIEKYKR